MVKSTDNVESKTGGAGFGPGTVLAALRRRPLLTAAAIVVAVIAAGVAWIKIPEPKNTGYVIFRIHATQPFILNPQERTDIQVFRQSQGALVKSRLVLNSALKDPKVDQASLLRGKPDKIAALEKLVTVDFRTGPEFMRVAVEGDAPEELRAIVNAIAESYLEHVANQQQGLQRHRRDTLQRFEISLQKGIDNTSKLLEFELEHQNDLSGSERWFDVHSRKVQLGQQKIDAETDLQKAQIELDLLQDQNRPRTEADATAVAVYRDRLLAADLAYRALAERRGQVRVMVQEFRIKLAPGKTLPDLTAAEAELKTLEDQCRDIETRTQVEAEAVAANLAKQNRAAELEKAQIQVQRCQRAVSSLDKSLKDLTLNDQRNQSRVTNADGYKLTLAKDRELLARVQGELKALAIEADAPNRVTKLESDVLTGAGDDKRLKLTGAVGIGSLVLLLAGLVFLEVRNPRVHSTRQLSDQLNLPVIGVVPILPEVSGLLVPTDGVAPTGWQVAALEAVNNTRTVLQYGVLHGQQARVILVGSAVSREGKTSLSLLLARSLAQAGNRTLLIDGDLRRPGVHTSLSMPRGPGLCEYLTGQADVAQIVYPSETSNLAVIPAGVWSETASLALAGPSRWSDLVRRTDSEYDYVLIDSCPILPVADALLMARPVDGVLLTVMRDVSELNSVKEALARLALVGARVLGVVVNGESVRSYYRAQDAYLPFEAEAQTGDANGPA